MQEPTATNTTEGVSPRPAPEAEIAFDLGVHVEEGVTSDTQPRAGWVFRVQRGRGVGLAGDRILWRVAGRDNEERLADIASIGLLHNRGLFVCRVRTKQGVLLSVLGAEWPHRHVAVYRDFVQCLHARLGPNERASIQFVKGTTATASTGAQVAIPLLWLLFVVSVVTGGSGMGVSTALSRASRATGSNAPGIYNPAALPAEMLPDAASAPSATAFPHSRGDPIVSLGPLQSAAAGEYRSMPALLAIFRSRTVRWSALGVAAIGIIAATVWAAGVRETEKMFQPGEVQRVLEEIDRRSRPHAVYVHAIKITARALIVTDIDLGGQHWRRWQASHTVLFGGWREWDRVSGPEPTESGIDEHAFVWLTSNSARLIGEIAQKALADAAPEAAEATINIEYDLGGETDWDTTSRHWVKRPRRWVIEVSDARGNTKRSFAIDPTLAVPER